jgi:hypothetical protein
VYRAPNTANRASSGTPENPAHRMGLPITTDTRPTLLSMAKGRGPVVAWSASVTTVTGGFAIAIASQVKSPLDNPLVEVLGLISAAALVILIAAGIPDVSSWASAEWEERRPPPRPKLKYWEYTSDGGRAELRPLAEGMSMELPVTGSMSPSGDGAASVRLVAVVACTEASLGSEPGVSARDRFEAFLQQSIVMTVVSSLTHVAEDARWVRCANDYEFDAVLSQAGEEGAVASARLKLPWGVSRDWRTRRHATLILHVIPQDMAGDPAQPAGPDAWIKRMTMALGLLPPGLAAFLANELGRQVTGAPPAVFGIHMAAHDMAELVDVNGMPPLPGSERKAQAWGYFIAGDGYRPWISARQMVVHMLRYALGINARAARWPWERAPGARQG